MGNLKVRQLAKCRRINIGTNDHKHNYLVPICVEVRRLDERGFYLRSEYFKGLKCSRCNAFELGSFIKEKDTTVKLLVLSSTHKWRVDKFDFTFISVED